MIPGDVYGNWEILSYAGKDRYHQKKWLCRCKCGAKREVWQNTLRNGSSTKCISCGPKIHGNSSHYMYPRWNQMIYRCQVETCAAYPEYGGRGIKVCKRWQGPNGFTNYLKDVGLPPFEGAELDRRNNDGDYKPSNMRWVTQSVNNLNRRTHRREMFKVYVKYKGKVVALARLAQQTGYKYHTLYGRIFTNGWTVKKAITTPLMKSRYG